MMERVRKADALTIPQFNEQLREFVLDAAARETVGDSDGYGGTDWIWVKHLGNRYHLNADTSAEGVAMYLRLTDPADGNRNWSLIANERGRVNKVAFGPSRQVIPAFYFYRWID